VLVINGKLRANTSLLGAFTVCGVHARFDEKPNATQRCPRKPEVQDITIYTASAGGITQHGVVVEAIEV